MGEPLLKHGKKKKKSKRLSPKEYNKLILEVLERDGGKCIFENCTTPFQIERPHHIKYKSQGGEDELENLVTLCIYCHKKSHDNKRKYKPILEEYIKNKKEN